uniref:Yippee domain-containing protein n=1 Tax=Gossypium raimondii TaxID=29730 RepID=A0A0D2TT84_GOSRA|nr:hypothetical protein B456_013G018700 [Gossypium raimondii]
MGRLFVVNLEGKVYSCKHCKTHLALSDDIVSKSFHCRHGKAYLFSKVVNVTTGEKEDRLMMTGLHTVADVFCVGCGSIVGWKYVSFWYYIFRIRSLTYLYLLLLVISIVSSRKWLMRRVRSTRKENWSSNGLRCPVRTEAITGSAMEDMWVGVMQMMFDQNNKKKMVKFPNCTFFKPLKNLIQFMSILKKKTRHS